MSRNETGACPSSLGSVGSTALNSSLWLDWKIPSRKAGDCSGTSSERACQRTVESSLHHAHRHAAHPAQRATQRLTVDLVVARAKLQGTPKLRFHDLRHTFASALIA